MCRDWWDYYWGPGVSQVRAEWAQVVLCCDLWVRAWALRGPGPDSWLCCFSLGDRGQLLTLPEPAFPHLLPTPISVSDGAAVGLGVPRSKGGSRNEPRSQAAHLPD